MVTLEITDFLFGLLSLITVIFAFLVGFKIIDKYLKVKKRNFLFIGLIWIGIYHPWWSSSLSFLLAIFFDTTLSLELYFIFALSLSPFFLVVWFLAFGDMVYPKYKKTLVVLIAVITGLYEIYLIYNVIFDVNVIGDFTATFDVHYNSISMIYLIFIVLILLITGILFSRESLKSDNPEIKLKGKFLLSAWVLWSIGAILDSAIPLFIITLLITRLILITSSILFYIGFLLPNFVKKRFNLS
ncbi:MAG: conserved membrane protein of unknown function [Promethearchaeota archaeon]|nr:MAG: conserved membrane protein of unknown function [Candidatus Lokiarchaeota archaeon]